jgi:hypothetical protein
MENFNTVGIVLKNPFLLLIFSERFLRPLYTDYPFFQTIISILKSNELVIISMVQLTCLSRRSKSILLCMNRISLMIQLLSYDTYVKYCNTIRVPSGCHLSHTQEYILRIHSEFELLRFLSILSFKHPKN